MATRPAARDARPAPPRFEIGSTAADALLAAIAEGAVAREIEGRRPFEEIGWLRDAGIGAVRIPRADGGAEATMPELFGLLIDLAAADSHIAHILRGHFAFVEIRALLPEPLRSRWLGEVVRGGLVGQAATELGSTAVGTMSWRTTATPDGDGHRLDGVKYFSTGTLYCDFVDTFAGGEDGATVAIVVPTDRDGVTVVDDWDGMGQRLTGTGTTVFEDVRVEPDEAIVFPAPAEGEEPPPFYLVGSFFQLYVTALIAGVLARVAADAAEHIHGRARTFAWAPAETPAADPLLQSVLGRLDAAAFAARATVLAASEAIGTATEAAAAGADPGFALAHEASLAAARAKVVVDDLGQRAASDLFDVGGASIVRESHALDRHWRNIRTLACHNPTVYKAQALGRHRLDGTRLPGTGYF